MRIKSMLVATLFSLAVSTAIFAQGGGHCGANGGTTPGTGTTTPTDGTTTGTTTGTTAGTTTAGTTTGGAVDGGTTSTGASAPTTSTLSTAALAAGLHPRLTADERAQLATMTPEERATFLATKLQDWLATLTDAQKAKLVARLQSRQSYSLRRR